MNTFANTALLRLALVSLLAITHAAWFPGASPAADAKAPAQPSSDDDLLEGFNEPGKPSGTSSNPKALAPDKATGDVVPSAAPPTDGEDIGRQGEDPLLAIERRMRTIQQRLASQRSDATTQELQAQAVRDLELLLAQLQTQQPPPGSPQASQDPPKDRGDKSAAAAGNSDTPGDNPATNSTDKTKPRASQTAEKTDIRDLTRRIWGQLPAKTQEQMLQSAGQRVLPKYEQTIEKYFRRLVEEDVSQP